MTELTSVRIAAGAGAFNWLPVFVAEELGLFESRGLRIDYVRLGAVGKATAAVREGSVDLAITPPEGAVSDYLNGGPLRVLAANSLRLPMSLVARPGLGTLAELRGARIGTSSLTEGTALYTQIALQRAGLFYPADYDFVLAGVHTARWLALQAGEIDCAPQPAPWNFLGERNGFNLVCELSDVMPEILFAAVIATAGWAESHRGTVERLLQALAEAHDLVNDPAHDQVTQPIYLKITTPEAPDLAARGFTYTRDMGMWPPGLVVSPVALGATVDLMTRAGLLAADQRVTATGVIDTSFLPAP